MKALFSGVWEVVKGLAAKAWHAMTVGAVAAWKWFLALSFAKQAAIIGGLALVGVGIYHRKKVLELLSTSAGRKQLLKLGLECAKWLVKPFCDSAASLIEGVIMMLKVQETVKPCPA